MSSEQIQSWNRPWTTQEIIDNASNWSLAGDAGLLKHLETLSENLLSNASSTNDNLNKLLNDLNQTGLALDTAKSEFSSLRNTQFIESRVYEDDETLPVDESASSQQNSMADQTSIEEEKLRDMKEAVLTGISVVEKYYEKIDVPDSDSEDETDFPSFVLNPKDPYINRPLPYVIGSEEWHKKWHVGLMDTSSESEPDNVSEKFSESDSEDNLPIQNRTQMKNMSDSGSEANLSNQIHQDHPIANSTFNENLRRQPDIFGSSDSEECNSMPAQAPISNQNFARELAAKLGNVIEQNPSIIEPEINKRPIQSAPVPTARHFGNLFSDEPPPIDEEEDELFGSKAQHGLFSGSGGLFDDLDDDGNFWKEDKKPVEKKPPQNASKPKVLSLFDDENDDYGFSSPVSDVKNDVPDKSAAELPKGISSGLFDDEILEEDDLFSDFGNAQSPAKSYLPSAAKTTVPYFDDEPPDLENTPVTPKKPVGGVKIFGHADLFGQKKIGDILRNTRQESSESSDNDLITTAVESKTNLLSPDSPGKGLTRKEVNITSQQNRENEAKLEEEKPKKISLFDDDNEENYDFGNDLFSDISIKKFSSNLFDEKSLDDDLFSNKSGTTTTGGLFSTPTSTTEADAKEVVSDDSPSKKPSKALSLFDDFDDPNNLFPPDSPSASKPKPKEETSITAMPEAAQEQKTAPSSGFEYPPSSVSSSINLNFFDQNPPALDDEWDTKSENALAFEENESHLFDTMSEVTGPRSSLFDNEPPSLFSESSGIIRDISTRVETDDSFNPYASSSRRFSNDIFNDQQSNDSFFVTKNQVTIPSSNLDSIPETPLNVKGESDSESNLEITPSGNVDDLFSDSTIADVTLPEESTTELTGDKTDLNLFESENDPLGVEACSYGNDLLVEADRKPQVPKTLEAGEGVEEKSASSIASKIGSPGKLKHNLQINVQALMPGALTKRRQASPLNEDSAAPNISPATAESNEESIKPSQDLSEPKILHSITKDRVRIPVKRRPSTRKGRQESLRKSIILESNTEPPSEEEQQNETEGSPKRTEINQEVEKLEFLVKQSTFEDFFGTDDNEVDDLFSSPSGSMNKEATKSETASSLLFDASPKTEFGFDEPQSVKKIEPKSIASAVFTGDDEEHSKTEQSNIKDGLFDDPENFGDIFTSKKLPGKSNVPKKSLFDDEPDDDDIFGSSAPSSAAKHSAGILKTVERKPIKTSSVRKLENSKVIEDPLSSFDDHDQYESDQ